jgi:PAB-dependent poly(A)-specific ribonuclease subunit 2
LARVSVVRGQEPYTPFIDDYIAIDEPIEDYLTEFSGINRNTIYISTYVNINISNLAEDLRHDMTKHNLVPLKAAYKKLRILIDMGCIFVGHGLDNDFRIIS